jgi:hypothetical protein
VPARPSSIRVVSARVPSSGTRNRTSSCASSPRSSRGDDHPASCTASAITWILLFESILTSACCPECRPLCTALCVSHRRDLYDPRVRFESFATPVLPAHRLAPVPSLSPPTSSLRLILRSHNLFPQPKSPSSNLMRIPSRQFSRRIARPRYVCPRILRRISL